MRTISRRELLTIAATVAIATPARADAPPPFSADEIVNDGQRFFGTVSRGLADAVQEAGRRWGLPNAYILGQEASGAFVGGLRFGEGKMYTRNAGKQPIFWQGPSIGFWLCGSPQSEAYPSHERAPRAKRVAKSRPSLIFCQLR